MFHNRPECMLIIEDDQHQAVLLSEAFKRCIPGISLAITGDATSALAYLADVADHDAYLPGLILLDLYLPQRQDALDLLVSMQKAFKRDCIGVIPVVVLTHSRDVKDIAASFQLGANAYMVKPDTFAALVQLGEILHTYWFKTVTLPKRHY